MGRKRIMTKAVGPVSPADNPKLSFVEQGLIRMGQEFSQAAKRFADENGATVFVHISLIPALKEQNDGGN
jgi:hypothetical protein